MAHPSVHSKIQSPQANAYLQMMYHICLYTHMDKGVAPAAWAIVLLVPPPPQGLPGQCNRHRCEREGQSLLFDQRPPPTHWSRRAHCQMRPSDFSNRVRLIPSISVLKPSMLLLNGWRPSIEFRRKPQGGGPYVNGDIKWPY